MSLEGDVCVGAGPGGGIVNCSHDLVNELSFVPLGVVVLGLDI